MNMPDMKKAGKMMKDVNKLQICGSVDAGMKLCRKNELHPIKSMSIHKSCRIPLLKFALVVIGVAAALCAVMMIRKKMKAD